MRVACVSERHVPHSEMVVGSQDPEGVTDGVATFDADERRDLARSCAVRLQDI